MFFRIKKSETREYLQIVENRREEGKVKQRVIATLGRLDQLREGGKLEALFRSGVRFCEKAVLLCAHEQGEAPVVSARRLGSVKVFERLWQETGCQGVVLDLLRSRRFEFPVERAIFLTVLDRLIAPGSDRACERWREDYASDGLEELDLHHLYRAMFWLGEELAEQQGATPFSPGCTKDRIEEKRFARRRDLFAAIWNSCSSTRPRSTSREKVVKHWDSADSARTIDRT